MRDFTVTVRKITDIELMREACEMTFNGHSKQSLLSIYKSEHSPVRTQMFWITFKRIDLSSATQILRHHVGSTPYQLTCRDDRDGGNTHLIARINNLMVEVDELNKQSGNDELLKIIQDELTDIAENCDRKTPVNLGLFINAQSLIDMSKLRLCFQAHKDTIEVVKVMKEKIREVDPELAEMMVRKCVYRNGLCGEPRCCGFNSTSGFQTELNNYLKNFSNKQRGLKE